MVYEQSPFEYANLYNDRWIYGLSASTIPSNQAIGTYHLLNHGNDGYDKGCCENHDGYAKNRTVTSAIDAAAMIRTQPTNLSHLLMTAAAFCAWVKESILEPPLLLLQQDDT